MTRFLRHKKDRPRVNEAPARQGKGLRLPRVAVLAGAAYLALVAWEGTEAPKALHAHETVLPAAASPPAELPRATAEPAAVPHLKAVLEATSPDYGVASWYGRDFQGRPTASGEPFDMHGLTAAHRTLPFGTPVSYRAPPDRPLLRRRPRAGHRRPRHRPDRAPRPALSGAPRGAEVLRFSE
jgi:Lytic transglycolase